MTCEHEKRIPFPVSIYISTEDKKQKTINPSRLLTARKREKARRKKERMRGEKKKTRIKPWGRHNGLFVRGIEIETEQVEQSSDFSCVLGCTST